MRQGARIAAAVLLAAACAAPKPCSRALCPLSTGASYRVSGWSGTVLISSGTPSLPIVSDSSVQVLTGPAEFRINNATVRAETAAAFAFSVSSGTVPLSASLVVSSGTVAVTEGGTQILLPGATHFFLLLQ